jgi:hypothetical protein
MEEQAREIVDRLRWLLVRWLRRDRPPTVGPTLERRRNDEPRAVGGAHQPHAVGQRQLPVSGLTTLP